MIVLLDTNILTRMAEQGNPQHQIAVDATDLLGKQGHQLAVVPQVMYEFWTVCTRPISSNGLGKTAAETAAELSFLKSEFHLLEDTPQILPRWENLVTSLGVLGRNAHDARLVAAMHVHGISHILTFNDQDFVRFPGITVLTPATIFNPTTNP